MALAVVLAAVAGGLAINNLAGANPATTDTTDVAFVAIPAKQVMGNNSIPAGRVESAIVIGGATTVPSNATTVQLLVTVRGTKAGTIKLYPAGNPAGTSGDTMSWAAGGTSHGLFRENVGMSNKVSVENGSLAAAVVTVKITGYSTQVTAGGINGSGGSAGQVLTNNGTGGATWATPGNGYGSEAFSNTIIDSFAGGRTVRSITLPAGSYVLSGSGFLTSRSSTPSVSSCQLVAPSGLVVGQGALATSANSQTYVPITVQGVLSTTGGSAALECYASSGTSTFWAPSLTAVKVGSVSGDFTSARSSGSARN